MEQLNGNMAIMASAGTGKTTQLAFRFINLLHAGVTPSEILAITFTKKAAGEIFEKIITMMLDMIRHPELLREYRQPGAESGPERNLRLCEEITREELIGLLREILNGRNRMRVSTIDSFFVQLVQVFSLELGVFGEITVSDAADKRPMLRVLRKLVRTFPAEQREFLRELIKGTQNDEEKTSYYDNFRKLAEELFQFFMLHPEKAGWGKDIWSGGTGTEELDLPELQTIAAMPCGVLPDATETVRESFEKGCGAFLQFAEQSRFTPNLPDEVKSFLAKLTEANGGEWPDSKGTLFFSYRKKSHGIPEETAAVIRKLARHIRLLAFRRALQKTECAYALIRLFDSAYQLDNRNAGRLTFSDLPFLLGASASLCTAGSIGERLNARFQHYAFDEFQDTSDSQWSVFADLVDELFQGEDGFRSLFCVGDVKQSIYQWRNGNPKLLKELIERYRTNPAHPLVRCDLTKSFRSAAPVIAMVNDVFLNADKTVNPYFALAAKMLEFTPHVSAVKMPGKGFSALLELKNGGTIEKKARIIFSILKEINPFSADKPYSVAILVRVNKTATALAESLRALARIEKTDLPITMDGKLEPAKSMAFAVYSQLLRLAYHPGDRLAREFLSMTVLSGPAPENPEKTHMRTIGLKGFSEILGVPVSALPDAVRGQIRQEGLAAFTQTFIDAFQAHLTDFDLSRMNAVRDRALDFQGSADEFLDLMKNVAASENSVGNTVQIMTVHKAKGLGFDIVFLPDLEPSRGGGSVLPEYCAADEDPAKDGGWINYLPVNAVSELIPPYRNFLKDKKTRDVQEEACTLYVALTRAKRAMYLLTNLPKKSDAGVYRSDKIVTETLLAAGESNQAEQHGAWAEKLWKDALSGSETELLLQYANGNPEWHRTGNAAPPPGGKDDASLRAWKNYDPAAVIADARTGVMRRRTASAEHGRTQQADPLRRFARRESAELGTEVHEIFSMIGFSDETDLESVLARSNAGDEAKSLVRTAFEAPAIRRALSRPDGETELWNEQRFLVCGPEGELIPGAFDRVVIFRDESGRPVRARIFDYKSDRTTSPAELLERHSPQLRLYRSSLAKMLEIKEDQIECVILALRLGLAIDVP